MQKLFLLLLLTSMNLHTIQATADIEDPFNVELLDEDDFAFADYSSEDCDDEEDDEKIKELYQFLKSLSPEELDAYSKSLPSRPVGHCCCGFDDCPFYDDTDFLACPLDTVHSHEKRVLLALKPEAETILSLIKKYYSEV